MLAINIRQPFASLVAVGAKICVRGPSTSKITIGDTYGIFASNTWKIRNPVYYRDIIEDADIAEALKGQHPIPENMVVATARVKAIHQDKYPKHILDNLGMYSCFRNDPIIYELDQIKPCLMKLTKRFKQFVFPIIT